jgi:hypothetical protein
VKNQVKDNSEYDNEYVKKYKELEVCKKRQTIEKEVTRKKKEKEKKDMGRRKIRGIAPLDRWWKIELRKGLQVV